MKRSISYLVLAAMLLMGMASATYSAVSSVNSLDSENDYATETYWGSAPTSTNYAYVVADTGYRYLVGINATSVGTSPKLNIIAGTNPPAFRASLGNYALSLTANRTLWFGPLENARFLNSSGYYQFTTTNVTTAKMVILKVKR